MLGSATRELSIPVHLQNRKSLQLLELEISPNVDGVFSSHALCMSLATLRASQEIQLSPQCSQLFILPSDKQIYSREGNFRLLPVDSQPDLSKHSMRSEGHLRALCGLQPTTEHCDVPINPLPSRLRAFQILCRFYFFLRLNL